jgi:hypothetical protein
MERGAAGQAAVRSADSAWRTRPPGSEPVLLFVAALQAVRELGEAGGQDGDGVVPFLVHVDDLWLPRGAAFTVIEGDHVVAR